MGSLLKVGNDFQGIGNSKTWFFNELITAVSRSRGSIGRKDHLDSETPASLRKSRADSTRGSLPSLSHKPLIGNSLSDAHSFLPICMIPSSQCINTVFPCIYTAQ